MSFSLYQAPIYVFSGLEISSTPSQQRNSAPFLCIPANFMWLKIDLLFLITTSFSKHN